MGLRIGATIGLLVAARTQRDRRRAPRAVRDGSLHTSASCAPSRRWHANLRKSSPPPGSRRPTGSPRAAFSSPEARRRCSRGSTWRRWRRSGSAIQRALVVVPQPERAVTSLVQRLEETLPEVVYAGLARARRGLGRHQHLDVSRAVRRRRIGLAGDARRRRRGDARGHAPDPLFSPQTASARRRSRSQAHADHSWP